MKKEKIIRVRITADVAEKLQQVRNVSAYIITLAKGENKKYELGTFIEPFVLINLKIKIL